MDYHVFILTRIKEARDHGMSTNEAVARGIAITAGTITSAAAIMVTVFAVFVTLELVIIKQLGFGLAVAVLLDATIVRSVLLPATMRLLGEWNWWLPGFLRWLPEVTIEGDVDEPRGRAGDGRRTLDHMTDTAVVPADARPTDPPTFRHFIAGEWWRRSAARRSRAATRPTRRDVVGRFQQGTTADVAMADQGRRDGAARCGSARPAPKRGEILYAFGALMAEHKERLARAMTREMGKVLAEARGDVQEGIDIAYLMAGEGRRMFGDTVPSELPDKWAMSIRQPIGIAGIITPWNFPMAIPCWKMMPALVTGNTVVFKPASDTPHCATLLVELMAEAGFPPGVVNLVTGSGGEVGDAIVGDPDVSVISFTGSSATGKADRRRRPARRLKRLSLELGGKNAVVVLADADLDLATDGILWSRVRHDRPALHGVLAGHRRASRSSTPLLERLESRARSAAPRLRPRRDDRRRAAHQRRRGRQGRVVHRHRRGARASSCIGGGRATDGDLEHGHFFEPTIFAGVEPMDRIGQEEIFGPVLSVIPVDDYGAAMLALNQTRYGLSSSIFTRDVNTAFRAMRDFETGIVYVNAGTTGAETHLPFGGWKETGNGHREAGHAALDTFTEWKSIYVDFSGRLQRAQIDNQPG